MLTGRSRPSAALQSLLPLPFPGQPLLLSLLPELLPLGKFRLEGLQGGDVKPEVLIFAGFVYIVETLSDIIQVTYFKLTHGKRIFKMAPIHHHFEMCGWKEEKIVFVFAGVSAIMCVVAWLSIAGKIG